MATATPFPADRPAAETPAPRNLVYNLDEDIAHFFTKASTTRSACDARARELTGGRVEPINMQGVCSYTVNAGPHLEYIVQFRLEPARLKLETSDLAKDVYGDMAPDVWFRGVLGEKKEGKEPLHVYLIQRIPGVTLFNFFLCYGKPYNSGQASKWRQNLLEDMARFLAASWKKPQAVEPAYREEMKQTHLKELRLLQEALPTRFQKVIEHCIESLDAIFSLPMVFLHPDLRINNLIVHEETCRLTGVIDWAEADIYPFGMNLHCLEALTARQRPQVGFVRYHDYDDMQAVFWSTFQQEVGPLTNETLTTINTCRVTGLLLSVGFTSRLPISPPHQPICDDDYGRNHLLHLDSILNNDLLAANNPDAGE
ncbi:hypothetical protein A1O3_06024 [Capronia epimyces CBS 606.96]|uniref:Aminoglycoside phosphotransferase domain-containing protein n=1 Tax=Capronia epimyces CBS 606.96 TaxID=1182542 RepID=W9XZ07_9EURO|nr:uncharacterized protein A1O3_06024 [Capronia epimyces CBS 606.96]EXJ82211.1 hypothetical protein A1O3_06024 [Capronia epimyces CBS 606.96]